MKVSTRGDYAVRVTLELAISGPGAVVSVHQLGERAGVPAKYATQLLRELQRRGIVRSQRGPRGGFSLGREPSEISIGEVIRLMDGPLAPVPCASQTQHLACPPGRCQSEETCVLRDMWLEVRNAIAGILDQTTFADLAHRRRISPGEPAAYSI